MDYSCTGQELTQRVWGYWDPNDTTTNYMTSTMSYDPAGNLTQEMITNTNPANTTTTSYNWTWQAGAYRLTTFIAPNGDTTSFEYDSLGRISRRYYNSLGYSDYFYLDGMDWLIRETWHSNIPPYNVFDLIRIWYANGRPSRMEIETGNPVDLSFPVSYYPYYFAFNWHGDPGYNGGRADYFGPWGNAGGGWALWDYYRWNGAWGYMRFINLGLYYVHGRWYNPDIGRFISPDEKGEYLYGSGNDAVNYVWDGGGGGGDPTFASCGEMQAVCVGWAWLTEKPGTEHMYFGPNDPMTRELMNHEGVNDARELFYQRLKAGTLTNGTDVDRGYRYEFFNYLIESGAFMLPSDRGGRRTVFFLGSYEVNAHKNDGSVTFKVNDKKDWESATRSPSYYGPVFVNALAGRAGLSKPFGEDERSNYSMQSVIPGLLNGRMPNRAGILFGPKSILEDRYRTDPGFFSGIFGNGIRIGGNMYVEFTWTERIPPDRLPR